MSRWIAVVMNTGEERLIPSNLGAPQGKPGDLIARHANGLDTNVHPSFYFREDEEPQILAFLQERAKKRKKS